MRFSRIVWLLFFITGCAENPPAPVIDRTPVPKKPAATQPAKPAATVPSANKPAASIKDWRPDSYTVKKGDTLHGIGLEYGYDYKDIAQANNIPPPYVIYIGQQLKLGDLKSAPVTDNQGTTDGNVVVTPLGGSEAVVTTPVTPAMVEDVPLLKEPKAIREPYSVQALAAPVPKPAKEVIKPGEAAKSDSTTKAAEVAKAEAPVADAPKPDAAKPDASKPDAAADDEAIDWGWPAKGKVVAGFNDATSVRGIDIAGAQGQDVRAAAAGKVIYSGADLRGYGKLVIIKHNKTYLSVYAHNNLILVREGQQIAKGQKIAEMGSSDSDRVKLHFEIRRQGKSVDPAKYLPGN